MAVKTKKGSKKPNIKRKRALDVEDRVAVLEKKAAKKMKKLEYSANLAQMNRSRLAIESLHTITKKDVIQAMGKSAKSSSSAPNRHPSVDVGSLLGRMGVESKVDDFGWSTASESGSDSEGSVDGGSADVQSHDEVFSDNEELDDSESDDDDEPADDSDSDSVRPEYTPTDLHRRVTFPASTEFTPESQSLLTAAFGYKDMIFCRENFHESRIARSCYLALSAHLVSHTLHKAHLVSRHNRKLKSNEIDIPEDSPFRDQGPTRPRVCVLCPFRANAYEIVRNIITLLNMDEASIGNIENFTAEYEGQDSRNENSKNWEDWRRELFKGHYDDSNYDDFAIGISFGFGKMKLHFPKTTEQLCGVDMIIGSPIALSRIASSNRKAQRLRDKHREEARDTEEGADVYALDEGKKVSDSEEPIESVPVMDFLCSIEILVIDRIDALLMQNMENALDVLHAVNAKPVEAITADINRIHPRFFSPESAKAARQTILIGGSTMRDEYDEFIRPEQAVRCVDTSYTGAPLSKSLKLKIRQQFFIRLADDDAKFQYFSEKFWKDIGAETKQLIIVVGIHEDFDRIKAFLDDEGHVDCFLHESELSDIGGKRRKQIKALLKAFRENSMTCIVVSERLLWYQRIRVTGGRHVLFYGAPVVDSVYANILADIVEPTRCTSSCIYENGEKLAIERIAGTSNLKKLIASQEEVVPGKSTVFTPS
jgi:U3 small nucleolar RNA-associated protein 25